MSASRRLCPTHPRVFCAIVDNPPGYTCFKCGMEANFRGYLQGTVKERVKSFTPAHMGVKAKRDEIMQAISDFDAKGMALRHKFGRGAYAYLSSRHRLTCASTEEDEGSAFGTSEAQSFDGEALESHDDTPTADYISEVEELTPIDETFEDDELNGAHSTGLRNVASTTVPEAEEVPIELSEAVKRINSSRGSRRVAAPAAGPQSRRDIHKGLLYMTEMRYDDFVYLVIHKEGV